VRKTISKIILKIIVSGGILVFFSSNSFQIFQDGYYAFSLAIFFLGLFTAMMSYFLIEGRG